MLKKVKISMKNSISKLRHRSKLKDNTEKVSDKRKKIRKIALIATLALATGSCLYFYPSLKVFRMFSKLPSLSADKNYDNLIDSSSNIINGRAKGTVILGSIIIMCAIFLLNSEGEVVSPTDLQPRTRFKMYEVPDYEPSVLPGAILFTIAHFFGMNGLVALMTNRN